MEGWMVLIPLFQGSKLLKTFVNNFFGKIEESQSSLSPLKKHWKFFESIMNFQS